MKNKKSLTISDANLDVIIALNSNSTVIINELREIIYQKDEQIALLKEKIKILEERLNKNSSNSSKPPSTDAFVNKKPRTKSLRKKSGKKPGGQEGHQGITLKKVDNPNEIKPHKVDRCEKCSKNIEDVEATDYEGRQVFDIPPITVQIIEHRAEIKKCPYCDHITKADFPEDIKHPVQYGPNIASLSVYLHDYQLIPYERSCELLSDVCGCEISPATLIRAEQICFENLEDYEKEIKNFLRQSDVVNFDETGLKVESKRNWLHIASTDKMTCYFSHPKRGSEAMDEMNILPDFKGTAVHDFWKSYFKYACIHSLCNSHLLRELNGVYENYNQRWSKDMGDLLIEIKTIVDDKREIVDHLEPVYIEYFEEKYNKITRIGLEENPPPLIPHKQLKKRGRKKQTAAKNLLDRFIGYKSDILRFMYDFEVPFDNNQAERDGRMMKLQQKISGTFRSIKGAVSFCRIRGYISTVKKNKLSVIDNIKDAIDGKPFIPLQQD
jgi:transposase